MALHLQDLKYAFRLFVKNPGFTIISVLTLALGIGANAAVFSVIDAVLLRRLPFRNPQNLVEVWNTYYPAWPKIGLSGADFTDWRQQVHTLSDLAGFRFVTRPLNLTGDGDPERVEVTYATSNLFSTLGVEPVHGRSFLADEDKPASGPVALISYGLWQNHFGGNASAVGRTVTLDEKPCIIIGVLPSNFHLLPGADLWLSAGQMGADDLTGRVRHPFGVIARLKQGATLSEAQAELGGLAQRAGQTFPATNKNFGAIVEQLRDPDAVKLHRGLLIVFAVVAFVLLVACANFTNLLLARNAARQKEIAVRTSIGASHGRIIRQLLTESVILSLVAGIVGLVFATAGLKIILAFVPPTLLTVKPNLGISVGVLAFTFFLALIVGILSGIPAIRPLRSDLYRVLKDQGRGLTRSGDHKLQSIVVVSEMALAVIPLIAAGLLIRGFDRLLAVDPGFRTDHILTLRVSQPATPSRVFREFTAEQRQEYMRKKSVEFEEAADTIKDLPGVKSVGGIDLLPLNASPNSAARFIIEGESTSQREPRSAQVFNVSVDYFATIGIPLVQGRIFTKDDRALDRVVINNAMAKKFWPGGNPVGKRINLCSLDKQGCWASIIGVVGDVRQFALDGMPTFDVYYAWGWTDYFVIHTTAAPSSIAPTIESTLHKAVPALPITHIATGEDLISNSVSPQRFAAILLASLAFLTLVLAAVGIYGVMSYVVKQRTQELGIRMALGARQQNVLVSILGRGARMVITGIVLGWIGAFAAMKALSSLLYQVRATDLMTFAVVAALLALVGLAACCIPAYRATRIEPIVALRYE
jgi:putative ABC transport system permease protein